jgi:homocysteine S-methyltransferase
MKPILLDGPVGTEIERRGGEISIPLWSAKGLLDNPDMIREIHLDYINAGADVITTNTFRTQERTFQKVGLNNYGKDMTQLAVELAKEAKKKSLQRVKIAGSIAPLEECYSPELVPDINSLKIEHRDMANWLVDAGIDLFLIETMNSIKEAKVAYEITREFDLPVWLGMTVNTKGNLLSGESWDDLIGSLESVPDVLFVNCSSRLGTEIALRKLASIRQNDSRYQFGFYPNYLFELEEGRSIEILREELFASLHDWIQMSPHVVGTCCGASPEDTGYLSQLIENLKL